MSDRQNLLDEGLAHRGDILGDAPPEAPAKAARFTAPRLEGTPPFPEPGIYFGMPEEEYHAIHAASTSGLKRLSVSSMDYWADSVLNPDRNLDENGEAKVEKEHFNFGKAIHCLVLEGEDCYSNRYVVGLDKREFPDRLETIDEVKAAIVNAGEKPVSRVPVGGEGPTRAAKKEDWIDQLLALDPDAEIWERIVSDFREKHEGAMFISANIDRRVRIAAKMILGHRGIAALLEGGYPEVSVFWYCRETGCPMKARFDKLTLDLVADLKSFSNRNAKPINRAIETTIANFRYNVQVSIYLEAAEEAKQMIRELDGRPIEDVVHYQGDPVFWPRAAEWCEVWAKRPAARFLFIFQQTGLAPVTRGRFMPDGPLIDLTRRLVAELKRKFVACCEVYGADPWVDFEEVDEIDEDRIPMWASEIGETA